MGMAGWIADAKIRGNTSIQDCPDRKDGKSLGKLRRNTNTSMDSSCIY